MSSGVIRSAAFNGSKFFQRICDDEHKGRNKTELKKIHLSNCKGKNKSIAYVSMLSAFKKLQIHANMI